MYRVMIVLSFILGIITAAAALRKRKVPVNIIFYSLILELMLTIYLGLMVTYVLSGGETYGLNSTGGALGMILGAVIFSRITPQYKEAFYSAYILALPLMYGLGKIGCAFAGCCGGIKYEGIFHIYNGNGSVFPIQALEAIVFILIFLVSLLFYSKNRFKPLQAAIIFSLIKVVLDFLRDTHEDSLISANQIMCLGVALVLSIIFGSKYLRAADSDN